LDQAQVAHAAGEHLIGAVGHVVDGGGGRYGERLPAAPQDERVLRPVGADERGGLVERHAVERRAVDGDDQVAGPRIRRGDGAVLIYALDHAALLRLGDEDADARVLAGIALQKRGIFLRGEVL